MNDQSSRTFKDLSVQNAAKFLQTVVVVDDRARLEPLPTDNNNSLPSIAEADNESSVGAHPNLDSPQPDAEGSSVELEDLDAKSLIDGLAKEGIACTVLRPDRDDNIVDQVTKIAELADIVVLDWILDSDNGERTTKLIRKLISGESGSNRIRLIAIYTGHRDLRAVADTVSEVLSSRFDEAPERPSDFVAVKGPVRLAVFGKAHTRVPPEDTSLSSRIVETSELPNLLIREFAEMTTGLLPNVAIAGLSEIRAQTHKLLTKFSCSLDPAYLGHRLLTPHPSDAEEAVVAMLVAEVLSILEHGNVAKQAGIDSIRAWISEKIENESLRPQDLFKSPHDTPNALLGFLEDGIDNLKEVGLRGRKWERVTHAFTSVESQADESNRQFAKLMHVKTRYQSPPPSLTLGTILFSETDQGGKYWICLQPKCDSVRIGERRSFPIVPMTQVHKPKYDFEIVVRHRDRWILLRVPRKPAEISMFTFEPDDDSMNKVTATSMEALWKITSTEGTTFEWVAELKDEHAQRIANEFASSFSRVGVSESEWVRRSGRSA